MGDEASRQPDGMRKPAALHHYWISDSKHYKALAALIDSVAEVRTALNDSLCAVFGPDIVSTMSLHTQSVMCLDTGIWTSVQHSHWHYALAVRRDILSLGGVPVDATEVERIALRNTEIHQHIRGGMSDGTTR